MASLLEQVEEWKLDKISCGEFTKATPDYVAPRLGGSYPNMAKIADTGAWVVLGDFGDVVTIEIRGQLMLDGSGDTWRYDGTLPYTTGVGDLPTDPNWTQVDVSPDKARINELTGHYIVETKAEAVALGVLPVGTIVEISSDSGKGFRWVSVASSTYTDTGDPDYCENFIEVLAGAGLEKSIVSGILNYLLTNETLDSAYRRRKTTVIKNDHVLTAQHIMADGERLLGEGMRNGTLYNNTTAPLLATYDDVGAVKTYNQEIDGVTITSSDGSLVNPSAAISIVDTGKNRVSNSYIKKHAIGIQFEASVGYNSNDLSLIQNTTALKFISPSNVGGCTFTTFNKTVITQSTNILSFDGFSRGLHFNECSFEVSTNFVDTAGNGALHNFVIRNSWFEGMTNINLDDANVGILDTCYFAGDNTVSGHVKILNGHVTPSSVIGQLYTDTEISEVSATSITYPGNNAQHGLLLTMPQIGSASTPVDHQQNQATQQSVLMASHAGTLFGYCPKPIKNLINKISQTAYNPGGYWPYGGATVTTGQADMFGTNTAATLSSGSDRGSSNIPTVAGQWYSFQMAFESAVNNVFKITVTGQTGSNLLKTNGYKVGDDDVRVVHMLFKADSASVRINIITTVGTLKIHRLGVFAGTQLRPMIPELRNVAVPFINKFTNIEAFAAAAPTTGEWKVGDKIINTTPASGGSIGWVCTTAGTPGTWKTYGVIS
jgi:hypothetical protein